MACQFSRLPTDSWVDHRGDDAFGAVRRRWAPLIGHFGWVARSHSPAESLMLVSSGVEQARAASSAAGGELRMQIAKGTGCIVVGAQSQPQPPAMVDHACCADDNLLDHSLQTPSPGRMAHRCMRPQQPLLTHEAQHVHRQGRKLADKIVRVELPRGQSLQIHVGFEFRMELLVRGVPGVQVDDRLGADGLGQACRPALQDDLGVLPPTVNEPNLGGLTTSLAEPLTARRYRSFMRVPQSLVWLTDLSVGWLSLRPARTVKVLVAGPVVVGMLVAVQRRLSNRLGRSTLVAQRPRDQRRQPRDQKQTDDQIAQITEVQVHDSIGYPALPADGGDDHLQQLNATQDEGDQHRQQGGADVVEDPT